MSEGWESGQGVLKGVVGIEESYSLSIRGRLLGAEMRRESYPYLNAKKTSSGILNYSNFIELREPVGLVQFVVFEQINECLFISKLHEKNHVITH